MHNFFETKGQKLEVRRAESVGVEFWGRGQLAPPHQLLGGLRERCKLPSGVQGKAPTANAFWCILSSKIASGGNFLLLLHFVLYYFVVSSNKLDWIGLDGYLLFSVKDHLSLVFNVLMCLQLLQFKLPLVFFG